jgi:hypothetical protein
MGGLWWVPNGASCASGPGAVLCNAWQGLLMPPAAGPKAFFPPEVAIHVVRLACESPEMRGRSLSPGDCRELARQLMAEGSVADIAAATGRRRVRSHQRQPWRHHRWLYPKQPRDAAVSAPGSARIELYTRPRREDEIGLSVEEQTALPPRPRQHSTLPAQPRHLPHRCEHADKRAGALHRLAAFDPRSGKVSGPCAERTRQHEGMACLEPWDHESDEQITQMPLVCDNVSTHHGQAVRKW